MMSESPENLTAILQLLLTRGIGPKSLHKIMLRLEAMHTSPADLVNRPASEISRQFGLRLDLAEQVAGCKDESLHLFEKLAQEEVQILPSSSDDYPVSLRTILKDSAPPVLFVRGNRRLLSGPTVGFCGARNASDRGLSVANLLSELLGQHGFNVASGYAAGVDLAAHKSALESGGTTTFVLSEGILRFKPKPEIAHLLSDQNFVVISQFLPQIPWEAHYAMQRNSTILGLSRGMVLVESGLSGGTFAAGEECLKLGVPLFVVDYATPPSSAEGNSYFLGKGAIPLRNGRTSFDTLIEALREDTKPPDQLKLSFG